MNEANQQYLEQAGNSKYPVLQFLIPSKTRREQAKPLSKKYRWGKVFWVILMTFVIAGIGWIAHNRNQPSAKSLARENAEIKRLNTLASLYEKKAKGEASQEEKRFLANEQKLQKDKQDLEKRKIEREELNGAVSVVPLDALAFFVLPLTALLLIIAAALTPTAWVFWRDNKRLKREAREFEKYHTSFVENVEFMGTPEYKNYVAYNRAFRMFSWYYRHPVLGGDLETVLNKSRLFRAFLNEVRSLPEDDGYYGEHLAFFKRIQHEIEWGRAAEDLLTEATVLSEMFSSRLTSPMQKVMAQRNYQILIGEAEVYCDKLETENMPLNPRLKFLCEYHNAERYFRIQHAFIPASWIRQVEKMDEYEAGQISGPQPIRELEERGE